MMPTLPDGIEDVDFTYGAKTIRDREAASRRRISDRLAEAARNILSVVRDREPAKAELIAALKEYESERRGD